MNSPLGEGHLMTFEHMNRAQKRAFILRDQLKYDEEQHLDMFIDGICNPEPPRYKRTSSGIQPPYEDVTIKHSTTRFDLGNVEFQDKSIRRVYLACIGDSYEMHESNAISPDEDDFNSVPLNYYVAQKIMPGFKKKNEAIHARMQRINDMRQHMYEQARSKPPKTPTRFKEGKSLAKLMDSAKGAEVTPDGEESRKRPGELVTRHPLNKKKRISLDNVSSSVKTEAVNRLPDQTKVDLFNAFVKSAFPDFDNLLMASWNVVSIFVNVGSEDLMLHNSIGDLHDVLLKFDDYFGKSRKSRSDIHDAARLQKDFRDSSTRNTPLASGLGPVEVSGNMSRDRSRDRLVELPPNRHDGVDEGAHLSPIESNHATGFRQSNGRYAAERHTQKNQRQHRTGLDQQLKQSPVRHRGHRGGAPDQSVTKQLGSRNRPEGRPLPQSLDDLFSHPPPQEVRRGSHDILRAMAANIEEDTVSSIDEGYAAIQAQKPPTPPTIQPLHKPSPPKPNDLLRRPEHAQLAAEAAELRNRTLQQQSHSQREAQRYGMFNDHSRRSSIDALFVGDNEDEAVQVPAMQEVHEQEKQAEPRTVSLGKSMLGAPKKPPNATGPAPIAPMMHNSPAGKTDEAERRGQ
ncbi:uncharacterized protein N0V89_005712 [Didymosphaeria variabile]|uniref:Uncharacterized protein n=1 Tax=Didymosphaeria variabile TaxID=1932322 RepID=A0A9W8XL93_9PLEO|nr:uncharacterized protein N0V89_005712 [Didymosphaeria variabile]KAJ4353980.1 hypothetical protein N0V89_005712 [Didymosphaeria variabile]